MQGRWLNCELAMWWGQVWGYWFDCSLLWFIGILFFSFLFFPVNFSTMWFVEGGLDKTCPLLGFCSLKEWNGVL